MQPLHRWAAGSLRRGSRTGSLLFALSLAASCAAPPPPDETELYNIDSLAYEGDPAVTPAGAALTFLSTPYPILGTGRQLADRAGLTVFPGFAEGEAVAYVSPELWENFEHVWVQPLYVAQGGSAALPVFSVASGTRFYSPYWQIFYYSPPLGVQFKSERDVLNSGLPLIPGPGISRALTYDATIGAAVQQGDARAVRPLNGVLAGQTSTGTGYVDGVLTYFVEVGAQPFTWDPETRIVDDTPLYVFARQDVSGKAVPLNLPYVEGAHLGALCRLTTVVLPPEADVYIPLSNPALRTAVQETGLPAVAPGDDLDDEFYLRVAANGKDCFASDVGSCKWLDSQAAIESMIAPSQVTPTDDRVSCPLMLFPGQVLAH
jgi:hypothetical protein